MEIEMSLADCEQFEELEFSCSQHDIGCGGLEFLACTEH